MRTSENYVVCATRINVCRSCLLYTSDAADDMQCVDLGGRRIIKKVEGMKDFIRTGMFIYILNWIIFLKQIRHFFYENQRQTFD